MQQNTEFGVSLPRQLHGPEPYSKILSLALGLGPGLLSQLEGAYHNPRQIMQPGRLEGTGPGVVQQGQVAIVTH